VDRRQLIIGVASAMFAAPLAAEAQLGSKVPRIGILTPPEPFNAVEVFQRGLRDLGYTDIRFEYRSSAGHDDRFSALARELVELRVDIIVAATVPAIRADQRATTNIPVVMVLSSDPVRLGLVKSLARPGGNTTGPASLTFDLAPKRLELFKEAIPKLRQIAVLVNPENPAVHEGLTQTETAGRTLGVRVHSFEVRQPAELDTAFAAILRLRPDGLPVVTDPLTSTHTARIAEFAAKNRLPSMWGPSQSVHAGGLIAYGIDYTEHVRAGLRYVDKILKGVNPADLQVELPTKFELVINMKTAKTLGLTIPQSVLLRADQSIQ